LPMRPTKALEYFVGGHRKSKICVHPRNVNTVGENQRFFFRGSVFSGFFVE
jgi:hypothetical protein